MGPVASPPQVLGRRALNRALLARQMLLARETLSPAAALEHLIGVQAQEPVAPYVALWTRLQNFAPDELSGAIAAGDAVRASLMRATIHLVTARDWSRLEPLMSLVRARNFKSSQFNKALAGVALDEVLAQGQALLEQRPRSRAELGALLASRWPDVDRAALAYAVSYLAPLVQVPPRGLWRQSGRARLSTPAAWLGHAMLDELPSEALVLRYLAAFGPAAVADIQAWSGLTRLREVIWGLRDRLNVFKDEAGRDLFDVPDGPLPDPDTSTAPRFLAPFDNAILSHSDRSRIVDPSARAAVNRDRLMRTFLVDGFVAGTWRLKGEVLELELVRQLTDRDRRALIDEGERLVVFLGPEGSVPQVRFGAASL